MTTYIQTKIDNLIKFELSPKDVVAVTDTRME